MIVVFGSINVDLVIPVPRLPAPGETVLGGDYALFPGGKGANQALAARRAGASVMLAGAVGRDGFAGVALDLLRRDGVDLQLVTEIDRPTGCAGIMVAGSGENMIAVASGANHAVTADMVPDRLFSPDTVVVAQMELPLAETAAVLRRARASGARTVLNLAPAAPLPADLLADIDLLVANEGEAASLGAAPQLIARGLRQGLVVTRGAAGAVAYLASGEVIAVPALPITPVDTTGAGDTFVGVMAASLDAGLALGPALRRAGAAAALACLERGAQPGMPWAAAIDEAAARLPAP